MRRDDRSGFALMAVLWILVVVGAVGIAFQADARAERRVVANARSALRARWAARAGLHLTMEALDSTLQRGLAGSVSGADLEAVLPPIEFEWDGVSVRAFTVDARARLNLNLADGTQLRAVFTSLGLGPLYSGALAAAVLDWRDPDGLRSPGGAEMAEYATQRPPSVPKNAPFDSVEELQNVFGVTSAAFARVVPYLTVVGDGRINVNTAPVPVLTSLPGIDLAAAALIATRRRSFPFRNVFEVIRTLPRGAQDVVQSNMGEFTDRVAFGPRDVEVIVMATAEGSPVHSNLWAEVELSGGAAWRVRRVVER